MSKSSVTIELFLRWLNDAHDRRFRVTEMREDGAVAVDGETRLAVEARSLLPVEDTAWLRRREQLEAALSEGLPGRYALWVPAGSPPKWSRSR